MHGGDDAGGDTGAPLAGGGCFHKTGKTAASERKTMVPPGGNTQKGQCQKNGRGETGSSKIAEYILTSEDATIGGVRLGSE